MNLFSLFRRDATLLNTFHPRMTWASRSLTTAASRTGLFLKKQLWVWPVAATLLLAILGYVVNKSIATTMKTNLRSELQTLLSVETEMLQNWIRMNTANAAALANSQSIRESIYEIKQLGQYTLETKLGSGGMGVVYQGHHAMLRRKAGIKLLDVDKVGSASFWHH